jgi:hypothetical protein
MPRKLHPMTHYNSPSKLNTSFNNLSCKSCFLILSIHRTFQPEIIKILPNPNLICGISIFGGSKYSPFAEGAQGEGKALSGG